MKEIFDDVLHMATNLPEWAITGILAWLISWGLVQGLKFCFPLRWDSLIRKEAAQILAVFSGFGAAVLIQPTMQGLLVGIIAGLWSPISYSIMLWVLNRYAPGLADILSGDVRGALIGEKKENRP